MRRRRGRKRRRKRRILNEEVKLVLIKFQLMLFLLFFCSCFIFRSSELQTSSSVSFYWIRVPRLDGSADIFLTGGKEDGS